MHVVSELDTLCITARELYGNRGVVLVSKPSNTVDSYWLLVVEHEQIIGANDRVASFFDAPSKVSS